MISRRALIAAAAGPILVRARTLSAQPAGKVHRLGILGNVPVSDAQGARIWGVLTQGLRDLGYVEGQNLVVDHRSTEGRPERLPRLVDEMVQLRPDVIVVPNQANAVAVRKATDSIPIVAANFDPLDSGLGTSFARPGGNVTGLSLIAPQIVGKQLELLKEMVPRLVRVSILWNPVNRSSLALIEEAKSAAKTLRLQVHSMQARRPEDLDGAFTSMSRERAGALLVLGDAMFMLERRRIADLAARHRLPALYVMREHMEAEGLVFYGPAMVDNFRRAALYVDKIFKGARPGDLPVEQPTKFELVVNLKTARGIGLTIPPSVLARADQITE